MRAGIRHRARTADHRQHTTYNIQVLQYHFTSIWGYWKVIFGSFGGVFGGVWGVLGCLEGSGGGSWGFLGLLGGHIGDMFAPRLDWFFGNFPPPHPSNIGPSWRHVGAKLGVFGVIFAIFVASKFNFNLESLKH